MGATWVIRVRFRCRGWCAAPWWSSAAAAARPTCHCATGEERHETTALSYSQSGRTRTLMLAATDIAAVARAVERYRRARAELDAQPDAGLTALISARNRSRRGR